VKTLAAILEQSGLVPAVPDASRCSGTPESKARSHVPAVPVVPVRKHQCDGTRAELERLAHAEGVAAELVNRLPADDVGACEGLSCDALRAYVRVLRDGDLRARGEVPPDETAAIHCVRCGPVFAAAEVAQSLPIIGGRPTAAGCPWCFSRKAGLPIPRPEPKNPDYKR
jgi:hypothetical protein